MTLSIDMFKEYFVTIVFIACLIIGYVIKTVPLFNAVANQYIPAILAVIGMILGCVATGEITLVACVSGALSGLMAVGFHQVFKQIIEKNVADNEVDLSELEKAMAETVNDVEEVENEGDE